MATSRGEDTTADASGVRIREILIRYHAILSWPLLRTIHGCARVPQQPTGLVLYVYRHAHGIVGDRHRLPGGARVKARVLRIRLQCLLELCVRSGVVDIAHRSVLGEVHCPVAVEVVLPQHTVWYWKAVPLFVEYWPGYPVSDTSTRTSSVSLPSDEAIDRVFVGLCHVGHVGLVHVGLAECEAGNVDRLVVSKAALRRAVDRKATAAHGDACVAEPVANARLHGGHPHQLCVIVVEGSVSRHGKRVAEIAVERDPNEHGTRHLGRRRGAYELSHACHGGWHALAAEVAKQPKLPEASTKLRELSSVDRDAVAAGQRPAARKQRVHLDVLNESEAASYGHEILAIKRDVQIHRAAAKLVPRWRRA
eukprot:scaffold41525_cov73-Phaeocystis_antarctica.AAC.8